MESKSDIDVKRTSKGRMSLLFAIPIALAIFTHGMIHLMYITWTGDVELGFSGDTFLPSTMTEAIIPALVGITILGNTLGALGLLRVPVLRDHVAGSLIAGNAASLGAFAIMMPGLVPDAVAHMFGPITSAVLMLGAMYRGALAAKVGKVLPRSIAKRLGAVA